MKAAPLFLLLCAAGFSQEVTQDFNQSADKYVSMHRKRNNSLAAEEPPPPVGEVPKKVVISQSNDKWYLEVKPGFLYFTDKGMRSFFSNGGFSIRGEVGYHIAKPLIIWLDGGYYHKRGQAIGGTSDAHVDIKLATITLGIKQICYLHDRAAFYFGVGPRVFMMMMNNGSPYVRSEDNEIGIGAGFDGGLWIFPFKRAGSDKLLNNLFIDLFVDYSWKKLKVEPDEISSHDFNVDVSSATFGVGAGYRF